MAEESMLRGIITFFGKLGVYDVILPFLLVFSIMYAILEKTKVFGTIGEGDQQVTRKNINAMVAFVAGFLVIASKQLVQTINQALANIVLVLIMIVMFLVLIGTFFREGEDVILEGKWRVTFMVIAFISIVLITLYAIPTAGGDSNWLETAWYWLVDHWTGNAVGSIVMVLITLGIIGYITNDSSGNKNNSNK
ncbi:MAG: hypothetical protein ACQEP1_00335 [Nanobdellota archaeon]